MGGSVCDETQESRGVETGVEKTINEKEKRMGAIGLIPGLLLG